MEFLTFLMQTYPGVLSGQYGVEEAGEAYEVLGQIAENRQCKLKGNQPDYDKAAAILLDDYRNGKLGHISLETPDTTDSMLSEKDV
jgi:ribosome biogenesis GTPase A